MSSHARDNIAVTSAQDVVDAVRQAAADSVPVTASRNASGTGRRLDLSSLSAVVDYPARDMTVTVEAGMTLQTLRDLLAEEGQHLPVDIGDPDMSVGAFVASDAAGPRQYGYGTLRDYVIGIEAVDGRGRVFHAGGRVVKNVAGYDLCRLMTGSRGSLAILTQLTFKLKPVPEELAVQSWQFSQPDEVEEALDQLNESATRPVIIDLESSTNGAWTLLAGVEGPPDVCVWQLKRLSEEIKRADSTAVYADKQAAALDYCHQSAARSLSPDLTAVIRTLPSKVPPLCQQIVQAGLSVHCHAGNGIILVSGAESSSLPDDLAAVLQKQLGEHGGHLRISATHPGLRDSASSYTVGLIETFDPDHVFG